MRIEAPQFNLEVFKRFLHIPAARPDRVQVEVTNKCNLDCKMCPRNDYKLPFENMSFDFFKKIMAKLDKVDLILPVGWGESFVHPDIEKIIGYLKENGHTVKITTNGLLLNDKRLRAAALKLDCLTFSIELASDANNYGHHNAEIASNIKQLIAERGSNKTPYVCVQTVISENADNIKKIIGLAKEVNADRVNLVRPYVKFHKNFALEWDKRKKIYKEAEKLAKKIDIRVDMFEYASFSGIKRMLWQNLKGIFRINKWCPRLYDFAYVTIDGKVTPCCALPRFIIGDLMQQSIEEIWNSKQMQHFRENHIDICRDCDVFKIK